MSGAPVLSGHYYTVCYMHVKHVYMCPDVNICCLSDILVFLSVNICLIVLRYKFVAS